MFFFYSLVNVINYCYIHLKHLLKPTHEAMWDWCYLGKIFNSWFHLFNCYVKILIFCFFWHKISKSYFFRSASILLNYSIYWLIFNKYPLNFYCICKYKLTYFLILCVCSSLKLNYLPLFCLFLFSKTQLLTLLICPIACLFSFSFICVLIICFFLLLAE